MEWITSTVVKSFLKRMACVCLLFSISISSIFAGESSENEQNDPELIYSETIVKKVVPIEIDGEEKKSSAWDSFEDVILNKGTAVRWIDRITVPEYAMNLYSILEEGVDNDGVNDYLIDVTAAEKDEEGYSVLFGETLVNVPENDHWNEKDWLMFMSSTVDEISSYNQAVCLAFDRDHPEVFWTTPLYLIYSYSCEFSYDVISHDLMPVSMSVHFHVDGEEQNSVYSDEYPDAQSIQTAIYQRDQYIEKIINEMPSTATTEIEQAAYFHDWLITHNEYGGTSLSSYNCISALKGSVGKEGPYDEGYAEAFMILCKRVGIECVLVDDGRMHVWNYIQIGSNWYGVDVARDDPDGGNNGVVSGLENRSYFLVGANTIIENQRFIDSHPVKNAILGAEWGLPNGPQLSQEGYYPSYSGAVVSGTALSPDVPENAKYLLYENTETTNAILADLMSQSPSKPYAEAFCEEPTVDEESGLYRQSFTFDGIDNGEYLLAIYLPGKYAPLILPVTVDGETVSVGEQNLWLLGDVNNDGRLNSTDAQQIQRYVVEAGSVFDNGTEADRANRLLAANVNWTTGNTRIDSTDAQQIQRYLVGAASVFDNIS